jgi:hypothetical protein
MQFIAHINIAAVLHSVLSGGWAFRIVFNFFILVQVRSIFIILDFQFSILNFELMNLLTDIYGFLSLQSNNKR